MTASAIILIMIAAFCHAIWNYLAKKSMRWYSLYLAIRRAFHFALFPVSCMDHRLTKADDRLASIRVYVRQFHIALPLAYILILTAMVFSPVSYIAPAREISILIGTAIGARLLSEGNVRIRVSGASAMIIGWVALSIG